MAGSLSPYIEFRNVEVQYPGMVRALRGLSLTIQRGEFVFFVGRTGAGKSTLIRLLTRELRPTGGQVLLNGRDVGRIGEGQVPALRREMGIVPQDFALLPKKKVWENVAYAMRAVGRTRRDVRKQVPELLARVNIAHRSDAFPHQLSGGEQQRVAIGRALINNPPLLIADEPTGNLDPEHSMEIMALLDSVNSRGTTVLVASHDMMVVERMGKRIITLDEGGVVNDTGVIETLPFLVPVEVDLSRIGSEDTGASIAAPEPTPPLPAAPEAGEAEAESNPLESDPASDEEVSAPVNAEGRDA